MIVKENSKLMERKHFLMRALEHGNITKEKYDEEMPGIEKELSENLVKRMEIEEEKLRNTVNNIKKTIFTDGDFKRGIARMLIKFLEPELSNEEIKGVMRQGYKIMRGRY